MTTTITAERIATIVESMAADQQRALRIPCPTCGAAIGEPCHPAAKPDQAAAPHIARVDAARPLGQGERELRRADQIATASYCNPRTKDKKRAWLKVLMAVYKDERNRREQQDGNA